MADVGVELVARFLMAADDDAAGEVALEILDDRELAHRLLLTMRRCMGFGTEPFGDSEAGRVVQQRVLASAMQQFQS